MQPDEQRDRSRLQHPDALTARSRSKTGYETSPEGPAARGPLRRAAPRAPRRGRGLLRKLIAFILVGSVVLAIAYAVYLVSIVAKISTNSWQLGALAADPSGRTNVLVLGQGDPGHAGENLTDTIMLLSLDSGSNRMAQVSIPRDLRVQIPGYGYSKINAANADGGTTLAETTVSNTLGVPIDYYVKTDFSGLKDVVDAVGGLDVNVKDRLVDSEYPCDNDQYKVCGLDIEPGLQHMDGTRALQYVRCRKGTCGNDFGRAARQQEVLGLLRPKVTDLNLLLHPYKLQALVTAVQKGIHTDLGLVQLLELGNSWRMASTNKPVNLVLSTAPGGLLKSDPSGSSDLLPIGGDFSAISDSVKSIFASSGAAASQ